MSTIPPIISNSIPKTITHQLAPFEFIFTQGSLSPSSQIDSIAQQCNLFRPPTMIFANNSFTIKHSQFSLKYDIKQSLKFINHEYRKNNYIGLNDESNKINTICYIPEKMFIKHAQKWKNIESPKDIQLTEIEQSSDCFFITPFKGHIQQNNKENKQQSKLRVERVTQPVIPVHKLGPQNPIQFYFQGSIYQDQLDDNGLIVYDYKFRSMLNSWFGLIRCYGRIDQVAVIILDVRIYWQSGWENKFARQFMVKKNTWKELLDKGFDFKNGWNMDPNQSHKIYPILDEILVENQYVYFK